MPASKQGTATDKVWTKEELLRDVWGFRALGGLVRWNPMLPASARSSALVQMIGSS